MGRLLWGFVENKTRIKRIIRARDETLGIKDLITENGRYVRRQKTNYPLNRRFLPIWTKEQKIFGKSFIK